MDKICQNCVFYEVVDPDYMTNPCTKHGSETEPDQTCESWVDHNTQLDGLRDTLAGGCDSSETRTPEKS